MYPALVPEHDLFLSHSGFDKDFTELLSERLSDRGYFPFFDKDRSRSLPPGTNASVPDVIFAAVRQCRVLIVILSEEFFTKSEWPMLELSAFVQSQKEELEKGKRGNTSRAVYILPVFLGLTRAEVKNERRRELWCQEWSKMEQQEKKKRTGSRKRKKRSSRKRTGSGKPLIDIEQWKEALQVLLDQSGKYTSCEHSRASGQKGLLAEIVSAVCVLVVARQYFPDRTVQGREAICEAINRKIEGSQAKNGVRIVGLHGTAGMGKTTFCKELCALKYDEFEGKVCHAELPSSGLTESSMEGSELKKEVLRRLTHMNPLDIQKIDLGRVREEKVFLALDNVKPELASIKEARSYLDIWQNSPANDKGSVVIVTAQHIDTLLRLGIERSNCLEMPELMKGQAKSLFLWYAAPDCELKPEGNDDILYCLNQCYFSKGGTAGEHYHPLALKVLGITLRSYGPDPHIWKEKLSKDDKFNQTREVEHPIFRILHKGYDMLRDEDKLLFMDVALLFYPEWRDEKIWNIPDDRVSRFFDWLSIVHHPRDRLSITKSLQVLKERAVVVDIEEVGAFMPIGVHELYRDFARAEVNGRGQDATRQWVWCFGDVVPDILDKTPSGNCWENVERVSLTVFHMKERCCVCKEYAYSSRSDLSHRDHFEFNGYGGVAGCYIFDDCVRTIERMKWTYFSNVVALHIYVESSLDLELCALGRLRSLRISVKEGTLVGLGKLCNLGWLDLTDIRWTTCAEDLVSLKKLRLLRVMYNEAKHGNYTLDLDNLKNCTRLQELALEDCGGLKAFPDLSKMESLRRVFFMNCNQPTEVRGLERLSKLEELRLVTCRSLRRLPDLTGLVSMRALEVSGESCFEVQQFFGLETMTGLQVLVIKNFPELLELPQLAELNALERLMLRSLPKVRELPDIGHMTKLQAIRADPHLCDILRTKSPRSVSISEAAFRRLWALY